MLLKRCNSKIASIVKRKLPILFYFLFRQAQHDTNEQIPSNRSVRVCDKSDRSTNRIIYQTISIKASGSTKRETLSQRTIPIIQFNQFDFLKYVAPSDSLSLSFNPFDLIPSESPRIESVFCSTRWDSLFTGNEGCQLYLTFMPARRFIAYAFGFSLGLRLKDNRRRCQSSWRMILRE